MSENERKTRPDPFADTEPDPSTAARAEMMALQAVQAGEMLRQLRQSAGIDAVLLASALKVGMQKIQALEEGRLDDLPGLTFARGLAAAVCRHFAADPRPVLTLMPQAVAGLPVQTDVSHEAFHTGGGNSGDLHRRTGTPAWLLAVVAALLVGAVVVWLVPGQHSRAPRLQAAGGVVNGAVRTAVAADSAAGMAVEPVAKPASVSESEVVLVADAASPPASAAILPVASVRPATTAPVVQASVPPASQPGAMEQNVVTFNAKSRVWLSVRDGKGKPVLDRILAKGNTLSAGGVLPLSVTVGDRTAVTVMVRGQLFDLSKQAGRGVVAWFTVDPPDNP